MSDQIAFVRHEALQPSPPPASETGLVKWLRENLFSNLFNAILTIVSVYVIFRVASLSLIHI